jgi:type I restriction enzyme R subunit
VLKNYTPYKLAFRLAHNGKEIDEKEVERDAALKSIMRWVRLHPYNISQKVEIVVEHFRENVAPLLAGKAKAMVVNKAFLDSLAHRVDVKRSGRAGRGRDSVRTAPASSPSEWP